MLGGPHRENCAQFWAAQCKKDEEEPDGSSGGLATESGSQRTCPNEQRWKELGWFHLAEKRLRGDLLVTHN